jgi:hypothetical protein
MKCSETMLIESTSQKTDSYLLKEQSKYSDMNSK